MYNLHLQVTEPEYKLYYLLDPIIFSVDEEKDFSDSCNHKIAHIGLCFGPDMPLDFFVEQGLTTINDKRLESVTHILEFD